MPDWPSDSRSGRDIFCLCAVRRTTRRPYRIDHQDTHEFGDFLGRDHWQEFAQTAGDGAANYALDSEDWLGIALFRLLFAARRRGPQQPRRIGFNDLLEALIPRGADRLVNQ